MAFAGSTWMLVGNRSGAETAPGRLSIRVQTTALAGASALVETNTRPAPVAAHSVLVLVATRSITATAPPRRVTPYAVPLKLVAPVGPIRTKSPQAGSAAEVVNSAQFASRYARGPPQSCVRQTLHDPWKIVPPLDGCGSLMIGG